MNQAVALFSSQSGGGFQQVLLIVLSGLAIFMVLKVFGVGLDIVDKAAQPKNGASAAPAPAPRPAAPAAAAGSSNELIAVITAAICASMGSQTSSLTVAPYTTSTAWSAASKAQNTKNLQK